MIEWKPGVSAPKDGSKFWAYLFASGIRKLRWYSATETAESESGDPSDYIGAFCEISDPAEVWEPMYWVSEDVIPEPPVS